MSTLGTHSSNYGNHVIRYPLSFNLIILNFGFNLISLYIYILYIFIYFFADNFSGRSSPIRFILGESCPKKNFLDWSFLRGNYLEESYLGGSCPDALFSALFTIKDILTKLKKFKRFK